MSDSPSSQPSLTYRDAGVDIDAGNALVERIKSVSQATLRPEVLTGLGGFGALCAIPPGYSEPILVSGTDGVGTKLRLAMDLGIHDTIGIDLVAMCSNDIAVVGAEPLFFLDYYATGKLNVDDGCGTSVVSGIGRGLRTGRRGARGRRDRRNAGHVRGRRLRSGRILRRRRGARQHY